MEWRCSIIVIIKRNENTLHLPQLLQDTKSLPPPRRPTEGLDEESRGSRVQRRKTSPHDIIDVEHLLVMATAHTQRQVAQQQFIRQSSCFHGYERQQGPETDMKICT